MRAEPPVPAEVLARVRAPFLEAGAALVDPPVIQPLNLFLDLAGEQMRARLFIVQDEGGREACLRPDFTVPVARLHIEGGQPKGRYLYEGKAFRVAPRGLDEAIHPEEFTQIGLELYGDAAAPLADAVIAGIAWRAASAGGRGDLAIKFGDVRLTSAFLDAIEVPAGAKAKLLRALSRPQLLNEVIDRACAAAPAPAEGLEALADLPAAKGVEALETLWRERGLESVGGRTAAEIVERIARRAEAAKAAPLSAVQAESIRSYFAISAPIGDAICRVEALAEGLDLTLACEDWLKREADLGLEGVDLSRATLEPGFGRAFGYYDGFLFEITSQTLPDSAPISAGGRYDGLLPRLGGGESAAVGCIVRPARAWSGS